MNEKNNLSILIKFEKEIIQVAFFVFFLCNFSYIEKKIYLKFSEEFIQWCIYTPYELYIHNCAVCWLKLVQNDSCSLCFFIFLGQPEHICEKSPIITVLDRLLADETQIYSGWFCDG